MDMKPYRQIEGVATVVTGEAERHAFWNPALAKIFSGPDDPNYGVIVILPYRIEYQTMGAMTPEICDVCDQSGIDAFLGESHPLFAG